MSNKKHKKKHNISKPHRRKQHRGLVSRHEPSRQIIDIPVWTLLHLAPDAPELKLEVPDGEGRLHAHFLAERDLLPEGFQGWHWRDAKGDTVAHVAAINMTFLPADFEGWNWLDSSGLSVASRAALNGVLPASFDQWTITDQFGPIAHTVARHQRLPEDFDLWQLRDDQGRTPAHDAADVGKLPKDFHAWYLADDDGWTVAHAAALAGRQVDLIPQDAKDFSTDSGIKVSDVIAATEKMATQSQNPIVDDLLAMYSIDNSMPVVRLLKRVHETLLDEKNRENDLVFENVGGITLLGGLNILPLDHIAFNDADLTLDNDTMSIFHLAAMTDGLPEGFSDWRHKDAYGNSVAHYAATVNTLPENFNEWRITDAQDRTVAEVYMHRFTLPNGFSDWKIISSDKCSLLRNAAMYRKLPHDFDDWELEIHDFASVNRKDHDCIAFFCAKIGALPKGFDKWDIHTEEGWTVAHEAAKRGTLPEDISDEILAMRGGKEGPTVAQTVLKAKIDEIYPPLVEKHKRLKERIKSAMKNAMSEENAT
ncbi:MAG: hypothetical protein LBR22_08175 [Desulfovibrio sp.]|jgi:hypothetical protein|nr:hypothetical protein [Desulfovibrio sp.]